MWRNDFESRLYVVKKRNDELYYTGGHKSGKNPQLYDIGPARAQCNRLNKMKGPTFESLEDYREQYKSYRSSSYITDFDEWSRNGYERYLKNQEAGPWVVAQVQFTASEVE